MQKHHAYPALALFLVSPALGNVVYSQPTTTDASTVGLGWYSSSEPRPTRNFKHADNFTLGSDSTISSVRWWGLSEGLSHTDLGNFDSFTIEFYSNRTLPNGNIRPLALIASETIGIASTNATATGRTAPNGMIEYLHETQLGTSVSMVAGTTYWLSISARSIDPASDVWQWQDSDLFDTLSSSYDYDQSRWLVLQDSDSAFELIAVPAPGTFGMLAGLALICQRRQRD